MTTRGVHTRTVQYQLHDDDDVMKTEFVVHEFDLETRWWYDDERPRSRAPHGDHDVHRRRSLSSLATSPYDSGPRSLIHSQSQLSRATREMPSVKGNTTKHGISQIGPLQRNVRRSKVQWRIRRETSNFRFLQIEMSRAVGAQ